MELEHRSAGLQWFLSFFLVFLHEVRGAHGNCILLLDEPGHSLHPLAQRDLSAFFEGLAADNQIVYTTHSPFLVDADRLARARKVFVDRDGSTRATGDLLLAEGTDTLRGAGFAVRAALSMAVAEASLQGGRAALVQGMVEQRYLNLIKTLCIAAGRFLPRRDLILAPACSAGVMQALARMLTDDSTRLPPLLVDDTLVGRTMAASATEHCRIIDLRSVTVLEGATIEDLMPMTILATQLDRVERRPERLFADRLDPSRPFVAEAHAWAEHEGLTLAADWRAQLAERVQRWLLDAGPEVLDNSAFAPWTAVLRQLSGHADTADLPGRH